MEYRRDFLDWSGDEVVEWTRPKWYEKITALIILVLVAAYFISLEPTPIIIVLSIANIVSWYIFLMFVIEDVKTKIIAWRIKRAAVRRWHRKYLFKNLFEKYPWLETYLREVRRAEELGFPYVPDIIIRDPATAEIGIRRPPPTRWWIPQQTQPQQATTPKTPPEQAPREHFAFLCDLTGNTIWVANHTRKNRMLKINSSQPPLFYPLLNST